MANNKDLNDDGNSTSRNSSKMVKKGAKDVNKDKFTTNMKSNKNRYSQSNSTESTIMEDKKKNLHPENLEYKKPRFKNFRFVSLEDYMPPVTSVDEKPRNEIISLFTLSNIIFLFLDVVLPAWDVISDCMVINLYWKRSNFTWVRLFFFSKDNS